MVHNGYPEDLFNTDQNENEIKETLEKYDISQPYYLYVGRLEKKKNTSFLVEALAIIRGDYPQIKRKVSLSW